jgi:hypothetical protein
MEELGLSKYKVRGTKDEVRRTSYRPTATEGVQPSST